ncbi:MAG: hypothetical protein SVW57_12750, partial [Thermodesulfobacteriota bacterium]|nr:hypothetical protein [Thermodesulfobacteriota bacterium]
MMVEGTEGEITQEEDYVFRYPIIRRACEEKDVIRLSRSDFFRKQLQNILDVIIPCCGNQEVKIDGFKLMSDRNHVVKLFNKKAHNKYKQEKDAVEIESFGEREAKRGVGDEGATTRDHVRNHDCSYQNMSNAAFY